MKFPIVFLVSAVFIWEVKSFRYCKFEQYLIYKNWKKADNYVPCCEVTSWQWELITWYFHRVGGLVNVVEIVRKDYVGTSYISQFLFDFYTFTGMVMQKQHLEYVDIDESVYSLHNTTAYQWFPEELKSNMKFTNKTDERTVKRLHFQSQIKKKGYIREDEPSKGIIVIAQDVGVIDAYLHGPESRPFEDRSAFYVLITYKKSKHDFHIHVSRILSELWKSRGILNAIAISTCNKKYVSIFYIDI